jgi:hypothetical protein
MTPSLLASESNRGHVAERLARSELEAGQPDRAGIVAQRAEIPAVDPNLMQVGVAPAKGDLQRLVECGQRYVAGNKQVTPDQGLTPLSTTRSL